MTLRERKPAVRLAVVIAVGAIKMRRLENYGLAVAASVLAIMPCSMCCLVSTPIGIWSLIVLLSPDVKQVFT